MMNVIHRRYLRSNDSVVCFGTSETLETERDIPSRRSYFCDIAVRHHDRQDRELPQSGALWCRRFKLVAETMISDILLAQ